MSECNPVSFWFPIFLIAVNIGILAWNFFIIYYLGKALKHLRKYTSYCGSLSHDA